MKCCALLLLAVLPALASALRAAPKAKASDAAIPANSSNNTSASALVEKSAQIQKLRAQLAAVSAGLKPMLDPKGALAKTEVGSDLRQFYDEMQVIINQTANKKDANSLDELQKAQKHVHSLVKELTNRQTQLAHDSEDQSNSLLLGVLMTRQKEPVDKQLEVLENKDFASLPVSKALLAQKDMKTPLFQQAAAYIDAHGHGGPKAVAAARASGGKKPDLTDLVSGLQARLNHLESSVDRAKKLHANETSNLDEEEKKALKKSKTKAHAIHLLRKREDRKFAKMMAIQKNDMQVMKEAIAAIKMGDIQGLARAQAALSASVEAMQSHNGGFLVLVQESLRESGQDCPFCVAQCVDKCHQAGKPYVSCLTDCADAGK
jgi:hypothetical protein